MHGLVIFLAKYLILLPVLLTVYIIWKLKPKARQHYVVLLVAGGILSFILAKAGGHLYYDPRPFVKDGVKPFFNVANDNGFPSDHTLLAAFLGFAALSYSMRWGVGILVVALIVGWARVDAGVHHLVDICGSFVFTGIAYLVVSQLQSHYQKGASKPKDKHHA